RRRPELVHACPRVPAAPRCSRRAQCRKVPQALERHRRRFRLRPPAKSSSGSVDRRDDGNRQVARRGAAQLRRASEDGGLTEMALLRSAKGFAVGAARRVFDIAHVDPAKVKALLRKPPSVHGGPRVRRWPWPRRRHFDQRERRAVLQLMNREIRRGGAVVYGGVEHRAYCDAFAQYLGGGYAHAVNSGTNAMYVALKTLDLEPGTEVIVPPITDPGGTMPVVLTNCIPIPADSDPR